MWYWSDPYMGHVPASYFNQALCLNTHLVKVEKKLYHIKNMIRTRRDYHMLVNEHTNR